MEYSDDQGSFPGWRFVLPLNETTCWCDFCFQAAEFSNLPRTPPPVEGRMHMDAQTEEFLEELTDR